MEVLERSGGLDAWRWESGDLKRGRGDGLGEEELERVGAVYGRI